MGMTRWQVLFRVEAPLGLPLLVGGLRSAALQIVATAVLAAYVGLGGLGIYIQRGISLRRYEEMLGGAIAIVEIGRASCREGVSIWVVAELSEERKTAVG